MAKERGFADVLDVRGVRKTFGGLVALDGVSFYLDKGTAAALVGANGAGKSTLLRVAAGLERATAGEVRVAGSDPVREGPRARASLGYAGHATALYDDLTVRENVAFAARFHLPSAAVPDAVAAALAALGLADRADDAAGALSRGLRQRTALARALAHRPAVVLLDEPYASLDEEGAAALDRILAAERARGATVLLSTHDAARAARADRVLRLVAGRLAEGSP